MYRRGCRQRIAARLAPVLATCLLLLAGLAHAATALPGASKGAAAEPDLPENLTRAEVRTLLSRLSDEQVRDLLMRELDRNALPAERSELDYLARVESGLKRARTAFAAAFASWGELPRLPVTVWDEITAGGVISTGTVLLGLALSLIAGALVEWLLRRALTGAGRTMVDAMQPATGLRLGIAVVWLLHELLLIAVFVLVAMGAAWIALEGQASAEPLYAVVIAVIAILRVVTALVDALVASGDPARRLVPITDAGARSLRGAALLVTAVLLFNQAARVLADSYGVSEGATALVALLSSALVFVVFCALLWYSRGSFSALILGDVDRAAPSDAAFRRALAASWPGLSIAYVLGVWVLAVMVSFATGVRVLFPALASLALVLGIPLADTGLRRLVWSAFTPKLTEGGVELSVDADGTALETTRAPTPGADYRHLILRYLRILMLILVFAAFLALWDIQIGAATESLVGARVARALFDIGVTALLAYALWGIVKAAVEYYVGPEKTAEAEAHGEGEGGGPGASRLQTLLPLFRKFILITIMVIAVLISLSALGVNIGPLIAGAGIVGIAIGFGAQTLVRDIVSGVFFLIDDAFRMGEYVEIDDIRGSVEAISVRSLRLRHHNGPLHTVPFGEIKHLTNYSRDWAIMKFELRVPYETDINKVRKIVKNIGNEMMQDPEIGPLLLGPLKSQGVNRMDDSALIIRCKFTALPGQQFYVRREAFTRIQKAFEENGIQFAPRRVIVEAPSPALAAAAAGVLDAEEKGKTESKTDDRG